MNRDEQYNGSIGSRYVNSKTRFVKKKDWYDLTPNFKDDSPNTKISVVEVILLLGIIVMMIVRKIYGG